jgi:SWI/SNF chromatin-remodeling complex subunit SWI1
VQNLGAPPFPQSNLTDPFFNLDSNAAKQMAALNAVNMQRLTNPYPRPPAPSPSQVPLGGTSSGSFLGAPYTQSNALQPAIMDAPPMQFSPHSSLQPPFAPVHSLQHNPASLEPSMPSSNVPPRHPPNTALIKQKQRSFLASLATIHHTRGSPLPPALTAVQYPPNYDPASSQWKALECSSEPGAFRLGGKDIDLFKLWWIVYQFGGGQKVFFINIVHHSP